MFCAYTRPIYQVSVDRTIGTLVFVSWSIINQRTIDTFDVLSFNDLNCQNISIRNICII